MNNQKENGFYGAHDLAIEVLSPGSEQYDRGTKKDVYEQKGVKEYWLVDPATKIAEGFYLENNVFTPVIGGKRIMNLKLLNFVLKF